MTTSKNCPHCGSTIQSGEVTYKGIVADPLTGNVTASGVKVYLTPQQMRVFHKVLQHPNGIHRDALALAMWGDGDLPKTAEGTLRTQIRYTNITIGKLGYKIAANSRGRGSLGIYRLINLKESTND